MWIIVLPRFTGKLRIMKILKIKNIYEINVEKTHTKIIIIETQVKKILKWYCIKTEISTQVNWHLICILQLNTNIIVVSAEKGNAKRKSINRLVCCCRTGDEINRFGANKEEECFVFTPEKPHAWESRRGKSLFTGPRGFHY